MRIKAVVQENSLGCGVACLAFVLKIPYRKALKLFPNGKEIAQTKGFLCKDISRVIKGAGLKVDCKYINKKSRPAIYRSNTIIFTKRSKKYPFGHYLCRHKNEWMDPWINFLEDKNLKNAKSGFRKRLPGKPVYAIFVSNCLYRNTRNVKISKV